MNEDFYHVVVNDEEQYSIWPTYHPVPAGWRTVGNPAPRQECLSRIEREWTDMTPESVREARAREAAAAGDNRDE
ncbi:MAG TPA: MbtH family protein [Streptosporangiaceae bacterium]